MLKVAFKSGGWCSCVGLSIFSTSGWCQVVKLQVLRPELWLILLSIGYEGTILSNVLTNWLSNGLVHLTVTGLLCYIMSRIKSKLGSSFILESAPMINLSWYLGSHDLTWDLITNKHSGCWVIDILFKPGTDLTGLDLIPEVDNLMLVVAGMNQNVVGSGT